MRPIKRLNLIRLKFKLYIYNRNDRAYVKIGAENNYYKTNLIPELKEKINMLEKSISDPTNVILNKWWDNGTKNFSIMDYKIPWRGVGNPPLLRFRTNGAKKKNGDKCLDVHLEIGYIVFNYTNFNLQEYKSTQLSKISVPNSSHTFEDSVVPKVESWKDIRHCGEINNCVHIDGFLCPCEDFIRKGE